MQTCYAELNPVNLLKRLVTRSKLKTTVNLPSLPLGWLYIFIDTSNDNIKGKMRVCYQIAHYRIAKPFKFGSITRLCHYHWYLCHKMTPGWTGYFGTSQTLRHLFLSSATRGQLGLRHKSFVLPFLSHINKLRVKCFKICASPLKENNSVLVATLLSYLRLFLDNSTIVVSNLCPPDDVDALGAAPDGSLIAVIWRSHLPALAHVPARLTKTDLRTCYQEGAKAEQRKLHWACWRLILVGQWGPTPFPERAYTFLTPQVHENVHTSIIYKNVWETQRNNKKVRLEVSPGSHNKVPTRNVENYY